jgi:hypothetical protein
MECEDSQTCTRTSQLEKLNNIPQKAKSNHTELS